MHMQNAYMLQCSGKNELHFVPTSLSHSSTLVSEESVL